MSLGHGVIHLYDQGFPVLLPTIASSFGLGNTQISVLLALRLAGFGVVNLGGGLVVDMLKRHWGPILTLCMVGAGATFVLTGASPNYGVLLVAGSLGYGPGALWHLPSSASLSQLFPDRRGFAISIHGFGANVGNLIGPLLAVALLSVLGSWRNVMFLYAAPALVMGVVVWATLRTVGLGGGDDRRAIRLQIQDTLAIVRDPVVVLLVLAAMLRGIGLDAVFAWSPFYLEETLGKGHLSAGLHFSLLTGMGIVSAPLLGVLSDRFGRKVVLAPGFVLATLLSLIVVISGDGVLALVVFALMGLFSFALHQLLQAAVLDVVREGTEATAVGLIFGLNGLLGAASPFLGLLVIDLFGGYGGIYYYAGALTAVASILVIAAPMQRVRPSPVLSS
jgi:MFS family permease